MATPGTTPLLLTHGPTRSWQDLSTEIYQEVVSYLVNQRATLEAIIVADCPATDEALRLYWHTASPHNDLLAILESKPLHHRQFFADFPRNITIEFKARGDHHEGRGLQYPRLLNLTVIHDQVLMGRESRTFTRIRRFIGPRLRQLEVGCQLHEGPYLKPVSDNFLPALSGCIDLRSFTLRARVSGATPQDLILALNNCNKLSSLKLEKHTEDLIDENTIKAIAMHPGVRFLEIDKHLSFHLLSLIANVPQPSKYLTSLRLCIDTSAAPSIFPHMAKLEILELTVFSTYGNSSIFPYLGNLATLRSMYLKFHNHILSDHDLPHLAPLKQLESLEMSDHDDGVFFDTSRIRPELFAAILGSLPVLDSFTLHGSHTFGDPFLIVLGRCCHALRYLTLDGPFTLLPLSLEQGVLFPHLTVLELGRVSSAMPLRSGIAYREARAGGVARSLIRHAPQLRQLWLQENGDGGLGGLIKEVWEEMVQGLNG